MAGQVGVSYILLLLSGIIRIGRVEMETKITLGEQRGCLFKDLIMPQVTPAQLEFLVEVIKERALQEKNYESQGIIRELKDVLQNAYDYWKREREKIDGK